MDTYVKDVVRSLYPDFTWIDCSDDDFIEFHDSQDPRGLYILVGNSTLQIIRDLPPNISQPILVVTKGTGTLDDEEPYNSQLGWTILPTSAGLINALWNVVDLAVSPVLNAATESSKDLRNVASANQKASELSMALVALRQHQELPVIKLEVDPQSLQSSDLDALQKTAAGWKRQIRALAQTSRDIESGSAAEEASFWLNIESLLLLVQSQMEEPTIKEVFHKLEEGKRFHATVSFARDSGLPDALERVKGYCVLFRDLALDELSSVSSIDKIPHILHKIFSTISRRLRQSGYPIQRAIAFVEAIGRDVGAIVRKILSQEDILHCSLDHLGNIHNNLSLITAEWNASVRDFSVTARDVMRKRSERYIPVRIVASELAALSERFIRITDLRRRHSDLLIAMVEAHSSAQTPVELAYETHVAGVANPLAQHFDWKAVERAYDIAVSSIENDIASELEKRLSQASDAAAMFTIFASAGNLIARPAIRAALKEYQGILISKVRQDISALVSSVVEQPPDSFGLPPASSKIVWMGQNLRRLDLIIQRLGSVLGKDWEQHADAQLLVDDISSLKEKLDVDTFVRMWSRDAEAAVVGAWDPSHMILRVMRKKGNSSTTSELPLCVTCDFSKLSIYEDVRAISLMGHRCPPSLLSKAETAHKVTVTARKLNESLSSINDIYSRLKPYHRVHYATRNLEKAVYLILHQAVNGKVTWDSANVPLLAAALERASFMLDRQAKKMIIVDKEIDSKLSELSSAVDPRVIAADIESVAKAQGDNLYNSQVLIDLSARFVHVLIDQLGKWIPPVSLHRFTVSSRGIALEPPISYTEKTWLDSLSNLVWKFAEVHFENLDLIQVEDVKLAITKAVNNCFMLLQDARKIECQWLEYQKLWDWETDAILELLTKRLPKWVDFLESLITSRKSLSLKTSGPLKFDVSSVIPTVNAKLDNLVSELIPPFLDLVCTTSSSLKKQIHDSRALVEATRVDSTDLYPIVQAKTLLEDIAEDCHEVERAHRILSSELLPLNYVYPEQIEAERQALVDIVARRTRELQENRATLAASFRESESNFDRSVTSVESRWETHKPINGSLDPKRALSLCSRTSVELQGLLKLFDTLMRNSEVLQVEMSIKVDRLTSLRHNIDEVTEVWSNLIKLRGLIDDLDAMTWCQINVNSIKSLLASAELGVKEVPPRLKTYRAFQCLEEDIKLRTSQLECVSLLLSPVIKPRHMIKLMDRVPQTLKDVWADSNKPLSVADVKPIVQGAEAEQRLEIYLEEVGEKWSSMIMIVHDGVLRNLPDALTLAEDHLAALAAMHSSPYFLAVQNSASDWETRLRRCRSTLEMLVETQKQWLRLSGIFQGSYNLAKRLPSETQRFLAVDRESKGLIGIVANRPVLEAVNAVDTSMSRGLTRLRGQLIAIHRSLTSFLDTQRENFPRLYFVGDDDVLDMISSGSIEGQLSKLFDGIDSLYLENDMVLGVKSLEGEIMHFAQPFKKSHDIVEMLRLVCDASKVAFFRAVQNAVASIPAPGGFVKWLKSHISEATLLAIRICPNSCPSALDELSDYSPATSLERRKVERVVVELLHGTKFRYDWNPDSGSIDSSIVIEHMGTKLKFGWEWHGTPEPLVATPLTDKFNTTAMLALGRRLSTAPFGPAGTGKTESVKALGASVGRRVVVFNCDDAFDLTSISRLLRGVSLTDSWACFDEFNRLKSGVLSSVSTEIKETNARVFVTMNPGYKGRQKIPTTLKEDFREFVMAAPESETIAEVLFRANGFRQALDLAKTTVHVLHSLQSRLSPQPHYDWSLRALKGILKVCATIKSSNTIQHSFGELQILHTAFKRVVKPRLLEKDVLILDELLSDKRFAEIKDDSANLLMNEVAASMDIRLEPGFQEKVEQLKHLLDIQPGVIVVGSAGSGKSTGLKLLSAMLKARITVIDPTTMLKETVLGHLDELTRSWTDGIVSSLLRKRFSNPDDMTREFIVFDGPIEPGWAESLNSLLDDNRIMSLPNGERLPLPANVNVIFETSEVGAATPATISRCGLVWFGDHIDRSLLSYPSIPDEIVQVAKSIYHVMEWTPSQAITFLNGMKPGDNPNERAMALAWAFAGDSDSEGRLALSKATGHEVDLTQFYVSELSNELLNWEDSVPLQSADSVDSGSSDLIITADTVAHESLLMRLISSKTPVLLIGPPGSGKTMTVLNALNRMPLDMITLTLSQAATPDTIIRALEGTLDYVDDTLTPAIGRNVVLFIDEVNLPAGNTYGTREVLQLLRSLIERGGFWAWRGPCKGKWVNLERVQIVAAGNPPPMRLALPQRLLRHFAVIEIGYPSQSSLTAIYTAMLTPVLHAPLRVLAPAVVGAMLHVYNYCVEKYNDSSIYSPRELTRWVTGLGSLPADADAALLTKLWAHEGLRLFSDRLEDGSDIALVLSKAAEEYFGLKCKEPANLLWCSLVSKQPKFVDSEVLRAFLNDRLAIYKDESANNTGEIVLHSSFLRHILRVDRVLKQPRGHMVLRGQIGAGKSTLIKFACWLNGLDFVRLSTWNGYGDKNFDADLRRVLLRCLERPLCFVLDESNGLSSTFLERMNMLLANDLVPGLFEGDDLRELKNIFISTGSGSEDGASADLWAWFSREVRSNLHIIFTVSSPASKLSLSPALLNRCVQDYIAPLSEASRLEVAQANLRFVDASQSVARVLAATSELSGQTMHMMAFLQACKVFTAVYSSRKKELEEHQLHLLTGVDRLREVVIEIRRLKKALAAQEQDLKAKDEQARTVLGQMLSDQSEAERKREAGMTIQTALSEQRSQTAARRAQVKMELAEAEPLVEMASKGVRDIRKAHLVELRSLSNPPDAVKLTLEAVCLILGLLSVSAEPGKHDWRAVQHAVRSDEFIARILSLNGLDDKTVFKVEPYLRMPNFTVEKADRASKACGPLLQWVLAQHTWYQAHQSVLPLLNEIRKLDLDTREREAQLTAIDEMLTELTASIDAYKREYAVVIGECESLKATMAHVRAKLSRSTTLLESLKSEQDRWSSSAAEFDSKRATLAGNSLLAAIYVAYAGPLDPVMRDDLLVKAREVLECHKIPHSCLDIPAFFEKEANDAIIENSVYSCLIVDPSRKWDGLDADGVLRTSFMESPGNLAKKLETALRFGQHIFIEHAERIDPIIAPIIQGQLEIKLPHTTVQLAPGFRLTLYTRDMIAVQQPLVKRMTVISCVVGRKSLEKLVTERIVAVKSPELAKKRVEIVSVQSRLTKQLHTLEKNLLSSIGSASPEQLLENESVMSTLESLKREAESLTVTAAETEKILVDVNKAYDSHKPTATTAGLIYKILMRLRVLAQFYVFSLDFLWQCLLHVIQSEDITQALIQEVWRRGAPALSYRHREAFSTALNNLCQVCACTDDADFLRSFPDAIKDAEPAHPLVVGLIGDAMVPKVEESGVVALGTKEARSTADRMLVRAIASGERLVVLNADMDPYWIGTLPERLKMLTARAHPDFRLIVSTQFPDNDQTDFPVGPLIDEGCPMVFERPPGVRRCVLEILEYRVADSSTAATLVWLHSVIVNRQWSKSYEFILADMDAALSLLPIVVNETQLVDLLVDTIYGAKMDSPSDVHDLKNLVHDSVTADGTLGPDVPTPPDGIDKIRLWASNLPAADPEWITHRPQPMTQSQIDQYTAILTSDI